MKKRRKEQDRDAIFSRVQELESDSITTHVRSLVGDCFHRVGRDYRLVKLLIYCGTTQFDILQAK